MIRWLLIVGLAVFAFITLATSMTQVQPGERLVVRRFGRILPEQPGPGLYIGLPWGIDQVEAVPINFERRVAFGFNARLDEGDDKMPPGQLLTGDHNLVNVQVEVRYNVREKEVALYALHKDRVDAVITRVAEALVAEWIASQRVDLVLLRGQQALRARLLDELPSRLEPYAMGIAISDVSLQPVFPPEDVRPHFEAVNQAETSIETRKNAAHQEADAIRRRAENDKYTSERGASRYAVEERLKALADAGRFLKTLEQYQALQAADANYLNVLWLEEMTRLYAKMGERVDLLDNHLKKGSISVLTSPKKK